MTLIADLSISDHLELALMKARELGKPVFQRWDKVLQRFDAIRGRIDPVMNENAILDVLIRGMEADHLRESQTNSSERLRVQIQLSRVWLFGAYEGMRTLHQACSRTCKTPQDSKPCGLSTCLKCHIGHVKNDLAVIRILMAKGEIAGEVKKLPLPREALDSLLSTQEFGPSNVPPNQYLLQNEGIVTNNGTVHWANVDLRLDRCRSFTRREYSNLLLTFFEFPHDPYPA